MATLDGYINIFGTAQYTKVLRDKDKLVKEMPDSVNETIKNIDENDTETKRMYTKWLNYMRKFSSYQLKDIKIWLTSLKNNIMCAYKMHELN